jgi:sugar O-acyltransferase (sialic acid O-acetyltransferase NeuD family)
LSKHKILLQGGADHAKVVVDCLLAQGFDIVAIYDPKYTGELFGIPHKGKYNKHDHPDARAIIAIGDNSIRKRVAESSSHEFENAIHPSVIFSSRATIGTGSMIMHGVIIQANSKIGDHVIINTGARIDHDCMVGNFVHVAPGAVLCGTISVGEGAFIGAGAIVTPGRTIGAWAIVGAGAVVIHDIPDYAVAVGNPARVIKYLNR